MYQEFYFYSYFIVDAILIFDTGLLTFILHVFSSSLILLPVIYDGLSYTLF